MAGRGIVDQGAREIARRAACVCNIIYKIWTVHVIYSYQYYRIPVEYIHARIVGGGESPFQSRVGAWFDGPSLSCRRVRVVSQREEYY